MEELRSEMAMLADPGFWGALAVVLVPYGIRKTIAEPGDWLPQKQCNADAA
ncbi:hypothetical protein NKI48_29755 [Mesorhizobium sp. M0644]|uniref:hypothetical protein n=1 Tax=unclassified Mesorhizobium TaxID=325217 RepID=UPI00333A6DA9